MSTLVTGSVAVDHIMVFRGRFKDIILPDKIHMLNVAFHVPALRKTYGGCAANIAFCLKRLGGDPLIAATVGSDFGAYAEWLDRHEIRRDYIRELADESTAGAYITTDLDDNQITAFHPGAMNHAHVNEVPAQRGISLGIVAPDGRDGMILHAQQFADAGIPFVFDPGQGLPMFDGEDLRKFIEQSSWVAVNDYEGKLLMERTGWDEDRIGEEVDALIITKGAHGSLIIADGERHEIPAVTAKAVLDPTGCGDAYRAGLLHGIERGMPWPDTGRLAALLGALKVASRGTQNHQFTPEDITREFEAAFGYAIEL